jgi:hypothetical protein
MPAPAQPPPPRHPPRHCTVSTDAVAAFRHDDGGAAMGAAIADSASHGRLPASRRATSLLDGVFMTNSLSRFDHAGMGAVILNCNVRRTAFVPKWVRCHDAVRPTMRFVQVKSAEQQGQLMLHRTRDLLMRQRTQVINALRAHMAELGIVAAQGREGIKELLKIIAREEDARLPVDAHASLVVLAAGLQALQTMIRSIEKRIVVQHRSNEASKRLETIPGIGVIGATAIAATVPDPKVFRSGRDLRLFP